MFQVSTPLCAQPLRDRVASSLAMGLPEVSRSPARRGRLRVVASGPSARLAPLSDGVPTLAVNGALRLFTQRGLAPDFWAACDPQDLVASFLSEAPRQTRYLLASKCHPAVFAALDGRDAALWHVADGGLDDLLADRPSVLPRVSVTLTAICGLVQLLGWDEVELWGWDGCSLDGSTYASPQPAAGQPIDIDVGGQLFASSTAFGLEAAELSYAYHSGALPSQLSVHGGGMFAAILALEGHG